MGKREDIPPIEIMRRPAEAPSGAGGASGGAGGQAVSAGDARGAGPWWVGSSSPLILRVPRGWVVSAVLGLVGLVALAYWVGYLAGVGQANGQQAASERQGAGALRFLSPPPEAVTQGTALARLGQSQGFRTPGSPGPPASGPGGGSGGVGTAPERWDRVLEGVNADSKAPGGGPAVAGRVSGLNYMVLATRKPADAQALTAFLDGRGVETLVVSIQNGRFVQVVAVNQGFKGGSRHTESGRAYRAWLREIGRAWKAHNGGRGDDLSSMYWDLYEAPNP